MSDYTEPRNLPANAFTGRLIRALALTMVAGAWHITVVSAQRTVYGVATPNRGAVVVAPAPRAVVVAPAPKAVVVAPVATIAVLPAGYIAVLPAGYRVVMVGSARYYYVGAIHYQARFYRGRTVYIRV
jgi:hypothetical protein